MEKTFVAYTWTQIVSTTPKLGLDDAYALVISDESQKNLTKPVVVEASALYSSYTNQADISYSNQMDMPYINTNERQFLNNKAYHTGANPNANRNRRPFCTHCQLSGHPKETCFKLNRYPPEHRLYKGNNSQASKGNKHYAKMLPPFPVLQALILVISWRARYLVMQIYPLLANYLKSRTS
ncbi:hypothetical protein QQ045_002826 [Rhodiola kirilowii]